MELKIPDGGGVYGGGVFFYGGNALRSFIFTVVTRWRYVICVSLKCLKTTLGKQNEIIGKCLKYIVSSSPLCDLDIPERYRS